MRPWLAYFVEKPEEKKPDDKKPDDKKPEAKPESPDQKPGGFGGKKFPFTKPASAKPGEVVLRHLETGHARGKIVITV